MCIAMRLITDEPITVKGNKKLHCLTCDMSFIRLDLLKNHQSSNVHQQNQVSGAMDLETDEPIERRSVLFCQRRVIFVSLVLMLLITVVYYGTSFR